MTEKLFYADAYMKEFDASVLSVREEKGKLLCELDRTAFYPEGGGQPSDNGFFTLPDGSRVNVSDVHEKGGVILHTIDKAIAGGTTVHGCINWERRFDHMQQHSGEHIVSGMICSAYNCENVGFHLGEGSVTIDYSAEISYPEILEIEKKANRYIWENHAFVSLWPSEEELKALSYRSKKELSGDVRIAEFPGADICACCGTHVSFSGEVGLVKFASAKKYKGGTRFELYCGKRAVDFLSMNYENNKEIAVLLSAKESNTPELVKKQTEELIDTRFRLARLEEEGFRAVADKFENAGDVLYIREPLSSDGIRKLADLISSKCGGCAFVFAGADKQYKYSVADKRGDISALIKDMNKALSGRGGGKAGFAQGNVNASSEEIIDFITETSPEVTF